MPRRKLYYYDVGSIEGSRIDESHAKGIVVCSVTDNTGATQLMRFEAPIAGSNPVRRIDD